jgi:hypothetical protein
MACTAVESHHTTATPSPALPSIPPPSSATLTPETSPRTWSLPPYIPPPVLCAAADNKIQAIGATELARSLHVSKHLTTLALFSEYLALHGRFGWRGGGTERSATGGIGWEEGKGLEREAEVTLRARQEAPCMSIWRTGALDVWREFFVWGRKGGAGSGGRYMVAYALDRKPQPQLECLPSCEGLLLPRTWGRGRAGGVSCMYILHFTMRC